MPVFRKTAALISIAVAIVAGLTVPCLAADPVRLVEMPQTAGSLYTHGTEVSMGDRICEGWLSTGSPRPQFAVFALHGTYSRLTGWVGVPDDQRPGSDQPHEWSIKVDGRTVANGTAEPGDPAVRIDVDVTGAASLRVTLTQPGATDPNPSNNILTFSFQVP